MAGEQSPLYQKNFLEKKGFLYHRNIIAILIHWEKLVGSQDFSCKNFIWHVWILVEFSSRIKQHHRHVLRNMSTYSWEGSAHCLLCTKISENNGLGCEMIRILNPKSTIPEGCGRNSAKQWLAHKVYEN